MLQARALVCAYSHSPARLQVSLDGAELLLLVPHLPRGFLQDLGGGGGGLLQLQCAPQPPRPACWGL